MKQNEINEVFADQGSGSDQPEVIIYRFNVTVVDPNATVVTQRKEKIQKTINVKCRSGEAEAENLAVAFYKKKGFRVIDACLIEEVGEGLDEAAMTPAQKRRWLMQSRRSMEAAYAKAKSEGNVAECARISDTIRRNAQELRSLQSPVGEGIGDIRKNKSKVDNDLLAYITESLSELLGKPKLMYSDLPENLTVDERLNILEQYHLSNQNLLEGINPVDQEKFTNLISMSSDPIVGNKYIFTVLSLVGNRLRPLWAPTNGKLLKISPTFLTFEVNGVVKEYPNQHVREQMITQCFLFDTEKQFNKFRTYVQLSYSESLPDITEGIGDTIKKAGRAIAKTVTNPVGQANDELGDAGGNKKKFWSQDLLKGARQVSGPGRSVKEGMFDIFKKKQKPQMLPLTQEQRNLIKKYFTSHNADIKWGKDGSEYTLPFNVLAHFGRGRFHFRNEDGQLVVSIEHYQNGRDPSNPRKSPLVTTDHQINGDEDMLKLRNMLKENTTAVAKKPNSGGGSSSRSVREDADMGGTSSVSIATGPAQNLLQKPIKRTGKKAGKYQNAMNAQRFATSSIGKGIYESGYIKPRKVDGPAVEDENGTKFWYLNDKKHRVDGPAVEYADGGKEWWLNGKRHRVDGPAVEYADGGKYWYLNGKKHRVDGPAVEDADGNKYWWLNGKLHRVDGPAIERANGDKYWYLNGKQHRVDGPAIERANGDKVWYLNGKPRKVDTKPRKVDTKPRKLSSVEQLCAGKVKKGDTVYVGPDYEHSVFIRAGEKMIHVHNYVTNQNEAVNPKEVFTKEGFKYVSLLGK